MNSFKRSPVTYTIIVLNIIVFIVTNMFLSNMTLGQFQNMYISGHLANQPFGLNTIGAVILSGFTHFSFLHIFFNMLFLYYIGPTVELFLKRKYYILLYFGTLIISGFIVLYNSTGTQVTIGASGALYGLLAFLIIFYYLNENRLRNILNINALIFLVVINVAYSFIVPNISIIGHLSGFLVGGALTVLIDFLQKRNI